MKAFKLVAALLPAIAVASNAAAQVSTTTVVEPVSTRTHTNIVFVTASAGSSVSTCLASFYGFNNASASELSTIRLTSFTTATTTTVITPPDVTTTIDNATNKSLSTSCVMRTASTITVTVTETSIPVITKSVYPVPPTSESLVPATNVPPYPSKSPSSMSNALPCPPYMNGTYMNTMATYTAGSTGYMPLHTNVVDAIPDDAPPLSAVFTATSSSYYVNTIHGPIKSTDGTFPTSSSAGRLRPLQFFAVLARLFSSVNGDEVKGGMLKNSLRDIDSRFYPYPAPLNSGSPPHPTNTRRDTTPNTTVDVNTPTQVNTTVGLQIIGTFTTTSTIITTISTSTSISSVMLTETYENTPPGPWTFTYASVSGHPVPEKMNASSSGSDLGVFATVDSNLVAPGATSSSVRNVTALVTVTEPAISTVITATTTLTSNVTTTVEKETTHTATVTRTTNSFTEGATPTAAGVVEELNLFLCYAMVATWFILFAMA